MRIVVFGTGAVGGYFGGRLAKAGNEVVFIARGEHLKALRQHGLKVDSLKGDFIIHPIQATDNPGKVGVADVILITVKAWQVKEVAPLLHTMMDSKTFIVPLQNGVESPTQLAEFLGKEFVVGGLCRIFSSLLEPGHICHSGAEPTIIFGEMSNTQTERVQKLYEIFTAAGVTTEIPSNIQVALWEKFLFVSSLSGLGAVTRVPFGPIREIPETRQMLENVMYEILAVAQGYDIPLPQKIVTHTMSAVDSLSSKATTSMQRDIMEGRPSELDAQTGAVVRLGQKVGVETPLNSFIYHSLLPMELHARKKI